jgi:hypothetical protein
MGQTFRAPADLVVVDHGLGIVGVLVSTGFENEWRIPIRICGFIPGGDHDCAGGCIGDAAINPAIKTERDWWQKRQIVWELTVLIAMAGDDGFEPISEACFFVLGDDGVIVAGADQLTVEELNDLDVFGGEIGDGLWALAGHGMMGLKVDVVGNDFGFDCWRKGSAQVAPSSFGKNVSLRG